MSNSYLFILAACSTVLLPAKVVQALNLNFDDMGTPCQPRSGSYGPESGKLFPPLTIFFML